MELIFHQRLYVILFFFQFKLEMMGFGFKLIDDFKFRGVCFTLDNLMKKRTTGGFRKFCPTS